MSRISYVTFLTWALSAVEHRSQTTVLRTSYVLYRIHLLSSVSTLFTRVIIL